MPKQKKKYITIEEACDIVKHRYHINGYVGLYYNGGKHIEYNYRYTEYDPDSLSYYWPGGYGCFWESEIKNLTKEEFIELADSRLDLFREGSEPYEERERRKKLYKEKMAIVEKRLCYKLFKEKSWKDVLNSLDPNILLIFFIIVLFFTFIAGLEINE